MAFSQFQTNYQPQIGGYQQPTPQTFQPVMSAPQAFQYQQPVQQVQQSVYSLAGRIVGSRDEALTVPLDPVTGVAVMPDLAHDVIYFNSIDRQSGVARLRKFVEAPAEEEPSLAEIDKRLKAIEDEFALAKKRGAVTASKKGAVEGD